MADAYILILKIIVFLLLHNCDVTLEMYFSPTVLSFSSVCVYINCIYKLLMDK